MKAISPFSPMGQRPVTVSPRMSLYHVIDLSTLVTWMPMCPTRLIVNPFAILPSSLPQVRPSHDVHGATVRTRPLTLLPLALGYACNGEYHNTDSRVLYQAQHAHE